MAYNILKHRRGTTQEWQDIDLIPEDGELVIEECIDGSRKCKVGDGHTKFSKLAYVDEETKNTLIKKVEDLKFNLNTAISALKTAQNKLITKLSEYSERLENIEGPLTDSFNANTDLLCQKIEQQAQKIEQQSETFATELNTSISSLDEKYAKRINEETLKLTRKLAQETSRLENMHSEDLEDLNKNFLSKTEELNTIIEVNAINAEKALDSRAEELAETFGAKLATTQSSLQNLVSSTDKKQTEELRQVKNILEAQLAQSEELHIANFEEITAELSAVEDALLEKIELLSQQGNNSTNDLLSQLNLLKLELQRLANTDVSLLDRIYGVSNVLTGITNTLTANILKLEQQQELDNSLRIKDLNDFAETQKVFNTNIINTIFDYITKIYLEIADLVDDDILILDKVFSVENSLTGKITRLESNLRNELKVSEEALETELKDTKEALASSISDLEVQVESDIEDAKKELSINIETLRSNTNLKFVDTQKNITNLTNTVRENQANVLASLNRLNLNIEADKEETAKAIDELNTHIDSTDSRIDNTIAELDRQAKRLSNIISLEEGSTTGDAELIDIRNGYNGVTHTSAGDAVRAIGNDLEDLKNSLPSYIPANAVDGLLYEDNLLYLTSDGVPVSDPVEITGGGGSSTISVVKIKNNLATTSFAVSKGTSAWIDFTYTSSENEVPTGDGTFVVTINNKKIDVLSGTVQHNIAKKLDITEYLKTGSNTVKITCTDQYGATRNLVYTISVIELRITSTFRSTDIFNDNITFRYKVAGQIEKTVHIFLDGEEISTKKLSASVNNSEDTLNIPKLPHGCHKLVAYMTAVIDGTDIQSNRLEYEILCSEPNRKEAMLASVFSQQTATQGDLLSIPYQIYDPSNITTDVELIVYSQVGGIIEEFSRTSATVGRDLVYWSTRQYPIGQAIFKIVYTYDFYGELRTIEKSHIVSVTPLKIDIAPEEDSLQLFLSSQGRSNTDTANIRNTWTFNSANPQEKLVTTQFKNFNWSTNGWVRDNSDNVCLRLNGDAQAIINFEPFAKDFKEFGKTLEFEFAIRDVNSRDTVVINCFDGTRGFQVTPDSAFLQSSGTKISCNFKDEERIRVAITVEHGDSGSNFVSIYLDGVLSGVQKYVTSTDSFKQVNPLPITIGSNLCGIDIYAIRVYDKALSTVQILTNYIADRSEPATKLKLSTDNDILDEETGEVSYQRLKDLGQIPIITFTGVMPTFKGDKKKNSVRMKFEDPEHPELNFDVLLKEIDVQGTSSAGYIRKNWKVKLPEARSHMPGAIPATVFCIKVDYAEATGTHNTGTANYVETLYDRNKATIPPQLDNPDIRTTIQGFPCVIFEKVNDEVEPVFSSKGNFNYDKGAEAVFGFTEEYDSLGVECWEFCNNISDCVSFLGPIPDDWKDDFEPRYVPESANFERIEELIEKRSNADKGDGIFTEAEQEELSSIQADCIKNFKEMHDWVLSTATYKLVSGNRVSIIPLNDAEASKLLDADNYKLTQPVTYAKTTYVYDTEEYRLAKFKNEFTQYFNLHYATMYYVFTLFALMVDQRAKNMFLTRWKNEDGVYRWYPYFYDNDTIFGINNVGALVFDYFHEDIDQIASSDVYNGQNSTLWNNFRLCFASEIEELYRTLRSDSKITYDAIIDQYIAKGSDKWSAAIYNADAEYKYVSMARPDENGSFDANNLKQVRGPGEHHLRYFIANRVNYCDSKWFAGNYPSDRIVVRLYTPKLTEITESMTEEQKAEAERSNTRVLESQSVVPASSKITVTPYSNMYAGVAYASGTRIQRRLAKGESYEFSAPPGVNTNDSETDIYGASMLSSLGDLSNLYCDYLDLSKATKLTTLKIGHESPSYHNDNIKSIALGNNRLLKTLDIRNCSGLGLAGDVKTLSLAGCQNIETIYAEGTNLAAISLPVGGYIKTLHLPASITTLVIQKHQHISDFSIESYENIKTLRIEDCSTLDTKAMLEACQKTDGSYSVEYVYLTGFNWTFQDASFIKSLFPRYNENGQLIGGVLGIKDNGETTENPAFLDGTCYIEELSGEDYTKIRSYFPYLKINFGKMTSNVTFKYKDSSGTAHAVEVSIQSLNSATGECEVPTLLYPPAWPENDAFTYELVGWSVMEQISKGVEDSERDYEAFPDAINGSSLKGIVGDRILYPVFKAVRKQYEVRFVNSTKQDDDLLQSVLTFYGSDAVYSGLTPTKQDAATPELYAFTGWHPAPEKITGPMTCYAQFTVLDDKWYTIGISDISDCVDYNGNVFDGYNLNTENQTITITECNNNFNAAVKIPVCLNFEGSDFTVVSVGGFSDHTKLELISLPESLTEILFRGFYSCANLFEITLPEGLQTIGGSAFQGCSKLTEFYIPATVKNIGEAAFADCKELKNIYVAEGNSKYKMLQDCLVDTNTATLLQGLSSGIIPQDGSVKNLGQYCFSNTNIESALIPDGVSIVPTNAFSRCTLLTDVKLPSSLKILDATCFAWCLNLKGIDLPEGLTDVRTYVFNSCALENVILPASIKNILERSFGDIPTLRTVTFKKQLDENGEIIVPYIHENAFKNSGSSDHILTFRVPWSADKTPGAPWGAVNYEVIFDYEEEL